MPYEEDQPTFADVAFFQGRLAVMREEIAQLKDEVDILQTQNVEQGRRLLDLEAKLCEERAWSLKMTIRCVELTEQLTGRRWVPTPAETKRAAANIFGLSQDLRVPRDIRQQAVEYMQQRPDCEFDVILDDEDD